MKQSRQRESVPTLIEFLLDETGSMVSYLEPTIGGFNDFINEQRSLQGPCLLTLTKFAYGGLHTPYSDLDLGLIPHLTTATFEPRDLTNLRDTIMARIASLTKRLTTWDIQPRVLFVCMTDGDDNTSGHGIETTRAAITSSIDQGWTFVYLGAHQTSHLVAKQLGFPAGNVRCFEGTQMRDTYRELSAATKAYRATGNTDFYASV